jgi:hypothetical protein
MPWATHRVVRLLAAMRFGVHAAYSAVLRRVMAKPLCALAARFAAQGFAQVLRCSFAVTWSERRQITFSDRE